MVQKILKIFFAITLFINATIVFAAELDHYQVVVNPEKVSV